MTAVPFDDFSGGQADRYIGTDVTRAALAGNFLIDETKKPYVRDGSSIYPQRIPGAFSPTDIFIGPEPFGHPIVINGPSAYVPKEDTTWSEIKGYNVSFLPGKTSEQDAGLIWRRQLITVAPVANLLPAAIYSTNYVTPANPATPAAYKALTLGLPPLASKPMIHYSGGDSYQAVYAFFYKYTFIDYTGTLFAFFSNPNKPGLVNGSGSADPSSSNIAISAIPALTNSAQTNYDLTAAVTVSTTYVANSTSATVASAAGLSVGQQLINANVTQGTVITGISGTTLTLSLPALNSTTSSTVYSALTVQIYRTINGGSVLFYNGMVANGVTSYTDAVSDATVQNQQPIYTSGGAYGYDQPPAAALAVTQTYDTFWYATSTTLYQSIAGAPGACPQAFGNQFDQKIIGLSDVISFPILFCDRYVYRIEGTFDSFGNNGWVPRKISETAGCISNGSIVRIPQGLVWFGNGGVYFTDGYTATKISKHLDTSYLSWASSVTKGEYDPTKNMVYWAVKSFPNALTNNAWVVLHLNYGIKDESVFTTLFSENNLYPTAMRFSTAIDILNADPSVTTDAVKQATRLISVNSATGIELGMIVTGAGVAYGTQVSSISGTDIGLTKDVTWDQHTFNGIIFAWVESWITDSQAAIEALPAMTTSGQAVYSLAFVDPATTYVALSLNIATTGWNFSDTGANIKAGIAALKAANPGMLVLASVGGDTYAANFTGFSSTNATAIANIVADFGLDGVDVDFEQTYNPPTTDTLQQSVISLLRTALGPTKIIVYDGFSVGAYGAPGPYQNAPPTGSPFTQLNVATLQWANAHPTMVNFVVVLAYDVGDPAYDPLQAVAAYNFYLSGNIPVVLGVEVPNEAFGTHVYTNADVASLAATVRAMWPATNSQGMAIWAIDKPTDVPPNSALNFLSAIESAFLNPATSSIVQVTFSEVIYSQLYSRMLFTDAQGYLLWFDPNSLTDTWIKTALSPIAMPKKAIWYEWVTAGLDQGVSGFRKYTPQVSLEVDAATPVAIQIRHRRDDGGGGWSGEGGTPPAGKGVAGSPGGGSSGNPGVPEIRQDGAITWDITDCAWMSDANEHLWNDFSTVSGMRSVPASQIRSSRRQLKFCSSYTIIAGSDSQGTAVVTGLGTSAPIATIHSGDKWITDPEGYYISFSGDGYNQTFAIVARLSDTVIQLTDPFGLLPSSGTPQKWEIKGYRKFERPRILNFTLYAEVDGPTYGQATQPVGANA